MLSVIIADDENKIRMVLKRLIQWKELGLELLCECADGDELLHRAGELRPDIILTDMRMPGVNGEELLRALRAQNTHVKLLVLSGFDEFALVHQALMSQAVDYLLKPVDAEELNASLGRAAHEYERETRDLAEGQARRRGEYLSKFLQNGQDDRETFFRESGLDEHEETRLCVALFSAYRPDGRAYPEKLELLRDDLIDRLGEKGCVCAGKTRNGDLIAALTLPRQEGEAFLKRMSAQYNEPDGSRLLIAVGVDYAEYFKLPDSYREASAALYATPICHKGGPMCYAEIKDSPVAPADYGQTEHLLRAAAESGNVARFRGELAEFYQNMTGRIEVTIASLRQCNNRMVRLLGLLLPEGGRQWSKRLHDLSQELGQLIDPVTSCTLFLECLDDIAPVSGTLRGEKKEAACKIRIYLQTHYCEKVSLQELADHMYLTKEYVSKLFKQEFSIGVFDYVDYLRLEKAKELLRAGHTVREVTEEVGYYDESHLNRKFKKHVGVAPRDYRS